MNDLKFESLKELYDRVLPALRSKVKELKRQNVSYIKEEDIWNILKTSKWMNHQTLTLAEMVDDILNTDINILIQKKNLEEEKRKTEPIIEGDSFI